MKGKQVLEEICLDEAHMPWFMSMIMNRIKGNRQVHIVEDSEMARDFFYLRLSSSNVKDCFKYPCMPRNISCGFPVSSGKAASVEPNWATQL